MNSDIFKGKWNQFKGDAKRTWGDLTDNDIARALHLQRKAREA